MKGLQANMKQRKIQVTMTILIDETVTPGTLCESVMTAVYAHLNASGQVPTVASISNASAKVVIK
jgi:hypothetical protein